MAYFKKYFGLYLTVCGIIIAVALFLSRAGSAVVALSTQVDTAPIVVIDAGHGGEDGGALSCTGVRESDVNLDISLRMHDLLHFLGIQTKMIRTTDISIYTEGASTLSEKKVSDLHNRVEIVNDTPNALLVSIHQNRFPQSKYRGAQVFYAATHGSDALAQLTQDNLKAQVDPKNNREIKKTPDVYLFKHVQCTAILIECGFLSNEAEEALLRTPEYQKKLTAAICCSVQQYLEASNEG